MNDQGDDRVPKAPATPAALPHELPETWMAQIKQACQSTLSSTALPLPPQPPESWVQRIKEATKPALLPAMLGSAVLAALIGLGSSYLTARITIAANTALESRKAELQLQQDRVRAKIKAYEDLRLTLDSLDDAFSGYLTLVRISSAHGIGAKDRASLNNQVLLIGISQRKLIDARRDASIADSPLAHDVDKWLAQFSPALTHAATDPTSILQYSGLEEGLRDLAARARHEADTTTIQSQ